MQLNNSLLAGTSLQYAWDSTSLGELKTCPRKYQLRILQGWTPKALSVHLTFGLAFHSSLEAYDHARARGEGHQEGVRAAVREALRATWDHETKRPWMSTDKYKNRENLVRTVVWYYERYPEDTLETVVLANGRPAVELSFRLTLPRNIPGTSDPYLLCGHLDRIAKMGGETFILDHKTTSHALDQRYFEGYTPHNQFSLYMLAGSHVLERPISGLICNAAQVLVEGSRFHREPIHRTPAELEEFAEGLDYWIATAEFLAREYGDKGKDYPMNEQSCGNYGGCPFRGVCSKTPGVRENWLKQGFEKKVWNPLKTRGDV